MRFIGDWVKYRGDIGVIKRRMNFPSGPFYIVKFSKDHECCLNESCLEEASICDILGFTVIWGKVKNITFSRIPAVNYDYYRPIPNKANKCSKYKIMLWFIWRRYLASLMRS
jgi:hypothetical protein